MIHSFRLRDSLRLQRLVRHSIPLHWERHLTGAHFVLWSAIGAPLAWHGTGAATYLYHPDNNESLPLSGFVQAIKRSGRPEADVVAIAPNPADHPRASRFIWEKLLNYLAYAAGEEGIQRLYMCVPSTEEGFSLLTTCGFAPYIQETIFRLERIDNVPVPAADAKGMIRPQRKVDAFALHRLYTRYTPALIQQAEGRLLMNDDAPSPFHLRSWWYMEQTEGIVYEDQGDIVAAAHITHGRQGHWLRLYGDPDQLTAVQQVLQYSLQRLRQYPPHPVYCTLRPHQTAFAPLLRDIGFEQGPELTRLVKHTTIQNRLAQPVRDLGEVPVSGLIPSDMRLDYTNPNQSPNQEATPIPDNISH